MNARPDVSLRSELWEAVPLGTGRRSLSWTRPGSFSSFLLLPLARGSGSLTMRVITPRRRFPWSDSVHAFYAAGISTHI